MNKRLVVVLSCLVPWIGAARGDEAPPNNPPPNSPAPVEAAAAPAPAAPEKEPEKPKTFLENTEFNATVDFFAEYNLADPTSNTNKIRAFDVVSGQGPQLNMGKLTINHPADPFGFRLDVGFGSAIALMAATDPASTRDPQEVKWHGPFEQAYVSFKIAKAHGLTIDAGKFLSPMGFEVPEARDNINYTRSLLFAWALPYFHTGLRLTLPVTDTVTLTGMILNGWNTFVLDGSKMRTGYLGVNWTPSTKFNLIANYMLGYTDVAHETMRHLVDVIGVFTPTDKLKFAVEGDFGYDPAGTGNKWFGAALYARYQILGWFAGALRGEVLDDADGYMFGVVDASGKAVPQLVGEVTATLEGAWDIGKLNMIVRLEYRHDQSDHAYFDGKVMPSLVPPGGALPACPGDGSCNKGQDTILVGVTGYWKAY